MAVPVLEYGGPAGGSVVVIMTLVQRGGENFDLAALPMDVLISVGKEGMPRAIVLAVELEASTKGHGYSCGNRQRI